VIIEDAKPAPGLCYTAHIEYSLKVREKNEEWLVHKRYREFLVLDAQLQAVLARKPVLPAKGRFGLPTRWNIQDARHLEKQGLQKYLDEVCREVGSLHEVHPLGAFLAQEICKGNESKATEQQLSTIVSTIDPEMKFGLPKPQFMLPKVDIERHNGIVEVAFGESKDVDGVEVTIVFKDGDRRNHAEDVVYDAIMKPRSEDLETFTFVRGPTSKFEAILFKGTYSGDQDWTCKAPAHMTETVKLDEFAFAHQSCVVWVNVWNHLFGPNNNNTSMEYVTVADYPCTMGTRQEMDSRYLLP